MALKTSKNITAVLIISLIKINVLFSCGWSENAETTRLAFFRAETNTMSSFRPFYYSAEIYNTTDPDPDKIDKLKNCAEWKAKLGADVNENDIYQILYSTEPENFQSAFEQNKLKDFFANNTFIKTLLMKKNKEYLLYIQFSKELEYYNIDSWNRDSEIKFKSDYSFIKNKLSELKDDFLKLRYAFQYIKISYYKKNYNTVSNIYNQYFESLKSTTILKPWALLYNAMTEDIQGNHIKANYLYSIVFNNCEEKKYVTMQLFNKKPEIITQTLTLAKSDQEKAVIVTMASMRNAGPALPEIKTIYNLHPQNNYFATLIMREINKIEDWIYTPMFTEYSPSITFDDSWYNEREKTKEINFKKDITYSKELKLYLIQCYKTSSGELKDYLSVAIAHLCFINDEIESGKNYLSTISSKASGSILVQKNIQLTLIKLKSENINNLKTQNKLIESIENIETVAKTNYETYKTLYSLNRIISSEYKKQNKMAIAGLFFMKSENYKGDFESKYKKIDYSNYYFDYYYWGLAYFDRYASIKDMDDLIQLISTKDKNKFENYLCNQPLSTLYAYKDLKATLAFRNNNLKLAEQTLSEIPTNFWDSSYEFKNYLNEDPFIPKRLSYAYERNFNYHFKKLTFIKELIKLINEADKNKSADEYLKLGSAYYNCSYNGNSWMMTSYGKGTEEEYDFSSDYLFGLSFEKRVKMQEGNYYKCTIAQKYYYKALVCATTDEQKAMANLMIHCCKEDAYNFEHVNAEDSKKMKPYKVDKELVNFYKFQNTDVFRKCRCSELDDFIAGK
jgi:hypothetical protein